MKVSSHEDKIESRTVAKSIEQSLPDIVSFSYDDGFRGRFHPSH